MTTLMSIEDIETAAARYLAEGFDFRNYTAHKIAHELIRWDETFKSADYTQLVSVITHWHRNMRP